LFKKKFYVILYKIEGRVIFQAITFPSDAFENTFFKFLPWKKKTTGIFIKTLILNIHFYEIGVNIFWYRFSWIFD